MIEEILNERCYEPKPRLHDWYGHHGHRFPIKGGITRIEAWGRNAVLPIVKSTPVLTTLRNIERSEMGPFWMATTTSLKSTD